MNIGGGEAADQLVRMLLSGTEVSVRLGGSALKNLLALTMALAKNNKTLSGKVNLGKMLRETRDLRQFSMTPEQYKRFARLAKKQKILFSAIRDRDDRGKLIDVILPVTELDRANMIFERLAYMPRPIRRSVLPPSGRRMPPVSPSRSRAGRRAVRNRTSPSGPRMGRCGRNSLPPLTERRYSRQKKILGRDETRPLSTPAPLHPAIPSG